MHNSGTRQISYVEAIREALDQSMTLDKSVIVIGEGVPDPKAIFNSTLGLQEKYGKKIRTFIFILLETKLRILKIIGNLLWITYLPM